MYIVLRILHTVIQYLVSFTKTKIIIIIIISSLKMKCRMKMSDEI